MTLHVLDIGSSNVDCRTFSPHYREGWQISTYDSDRSVQPTYVGDIRDIHHVLAEAGAPHFDAVYLSHIMEHLYEHEQERVLTMCARQLRKTGYAEVWVPDLAAVCTAVHHGRRLDGVLYQAFGGFPVRPLDVLYGLKQEVMIAPAWAHCSGFDAALLVALMRKVFPNVAQIQRGIAFEIGAIGWWEQRPGWLPE